MVWLLYESHFLTTRVSIQGRYFDPTGEPAGPVFELPWSSLRPSLEMIDVAPLADHRMVVAWTGREPTGIGDDVYARIVQPSGLPEGPPFVVNSYTEDDQSRLALASNGRDRFVVAWESEGQDGLFTGIYGQLFDGRGGRIGGELHLSSDALSDQDLPAVTMDRLGNFVVGHFSGFEGPELGEDTFLRAYRADGSPRGPQIRANDEILFEQLYATLDLSDAGLLQVAYQSFRYGPDSSPPEWDILARRFALACEPDDHTLCLGAQNRFQVRAFWRTPAGEDGAASPLPLTADTGGFYFFSPGNFELLVKVLDACAINGNYWIYAAGLTDVAVELVVTDTWTGEAEVFENPLGQAFTPLQKLDLLNGCAASPPAGASHDPAAIPAPPLAAGAPCSPDSSLLCFQSGRFRVKASWRDFLGQTGRATAFPVTDESGLFYFFSPANLELAVKVLDGCAINDHFWVFAVGLTDVAVSLEVEDTRTGQIWRRETQLGQAFPALLDTGGFATCSAGD